MNRQSFMIAAFAAVFLSGSALVEAGERINQYLPQWIKADLEFRYRLEYRNNFDFNDSKDDEDRFDLLRSRLNLQWIPHKQFKVFSQWQDSRIANYKFHNKVAFENQIDLRQLYADVEQPFTDGPMGLNKILVRGGRQEFSYGGQRLLGGFNWSNVAQTFDGGKAVLSFEPYKFQVDVLAAELTPIKSPRETDDLFDDSSEDELAGYYATYKGIKDTTAEQYLFWRGTDKNISFGPNGTAELDEFTIGGRLKGPLPQRLDYEVELARQWGDFGSKDVAAMMGIAILGYTFDHAWNPRMAFEFDYGSGDSDPANGTRKTFDNLYPTNHLFYGYMDLISLQNLNSYAFQLSAKPNKKLKLQADLHMLYLDTPKDSLYSASRAVTRTAVASASDVSSHVGQELDLLMDYK
ncbi:MAG: alginate export family protein, partial [Candidatus Omnitrophica bacterium]|nr:alginate export family protein [Candidatus Omnitrophota bacterium]